jgi:hypothetical protein
MIQESVYQDLINQGYTEQEIRQIMELGALHEQMGLINDEQKFAQALRNSRTPGGRFLSNGRIFMSDGLAPTLSNLGKNLAGHHSYRQGQRQQSAILRDIARRRLAYLMMGGIPDIEPGALAPPGPDYNFNIAEDAGVVEETPRDVSSGMGGAGFNIAEDAGRSGIIRRPPIPPDSDAQTFPLIEEDVGRSGIIRRPLLSRRQQLGALVL